MKPTNSSLPSSLMKYLLLWLFALTLAPVAVAQTTEQKPRFWDTVQRFKKQDEQQAPPKKAVLFLGSSSFTNWKSAQQAFPEQVILNRGFGGSELPDISYYLHETKLPQKLKQVVIYCGDNDIAGGASPEEVLRRFETVFQFIRKEQPKVPIAFVSIKPCPARAKFIPKVIEANQLVKDFLAQQKRTDYIDVFYPTMTEVGEPMPDIFLADGIHLNQKGYDIWTTVMKPYLKK